MANPGYDDDGEPLVKGVITATGIAVVGSENDDTAARIEAAVVAEILACNAEGIPSDEANAWRIRERMTAARNRELAKIEVERRG